MRLKRTAQLGLLLGTAALSTGCASLGKLGGTPAKGDSDKSPWSITELWEQEYPTPQSIAVIWAPDILTVPGQTPTRGFGGRIYFYNERSQAIPIEGDLTIHGYARSVESREGEQVKADKTFRFTAEQLTSHFSPSQMGASYSIWVPWDAADGDRDEITLIPTFQTKDGGIVQGAPAKLFLPGKGSNKPAYGQQRSSSPFQTVSYRQSSTPTNPGIELPKADSGRRTTTIPIPSDSALMRSQLNGRAAKGVKSFTLGGQNASPTPASTQTPRSFTLGNGAPQVAPSTSSAVPGTGSVTMPTVNPAALQAAGFQAAGLSNTVGLPATGAAGSMVPAAANAVVPASATAPKSALEAELGLSPASSAFSGGSIGQGVSELRPPNYNLPKMKSPFAHKPWHKQ